MSVEKVQTVLVADVELCAELDQEMDRDHVAATHD
jgi:hypothetical protein